MSAAHAAAHAAPAPPGPAAAALRDAGISALATLGLFGAMLGVQTESTPTGLALVPRPLLLTGAVLAVFAGRLAWLLLRGRAPARAYAGKRRLAEGLQRSGRFVAPALLALAVLLPVFGGRYAINTGIMILTYVMLGWGLNIVVGLAGLLDLGYVAFYAVGAYSYGLLSTTYGLGFWTCLPLAGLLAAFCGMLLGFPVLRLRGDYLAIVTLGFGEIIRVFLLTSYGVTGGSNGMGGIPGPTLFGLRFSNAGGPGTFANALGIEPNPVQRFIFLYYIILGLALLTNWVTLRLRRVALGRAWEALREDEVACRSLGINVTVTKLTAFSIGAGFGGLAGAFFATQAAFITPESFTFFESALILAIVVLGGLGSQLGVALAAVILIGGSELLRDFESYRNLIFGGAMVVTMVLRPRGLVSGRTPSVALAQRREISAELVAEGRG